MPYYIAFPRSLPLFCSNEFLHSGSISGDGFLSYGLILNRPSSRIKGDIVTFVPCRCLYHRCECVSVCGTPVLDANRRSRLPPDWQTFLVTGGNVKTSPVEIEIILILYSVVLQWNDCRNPFGNYSNTDDDFGSSSCLGGLFEVRLRLEIRLSWFGYRGSCLKIRFVKEILDKNCRHKLSVRVKPFWNQWRRGNR